jgi:protein-disulfide isomerase
MEIAKENKAEIQKENLEENKSAKSGANPWMIASIILAVAVIVLFLLIIFKGGFSGNLSGPEAGTQITAFLNKQTNGGVEYVSYADKGNLWTITVKYKNQSIPVDVTKDGKYFVQGAVLITQTNSTADTSQQPPKDVVKSDKPKVELFVMSYCPYGTQIEKGIIPAVQALGSSIDFSIKFVDYSMHGKKELDENTLQYCLQKEQSNKLIPYLICFLKAGNSSSCLTSTGIDTAKLNSCISTADTQFKITANFNDKSTWSGGQFPPFNIDKDLNTKYGVQGSPTLVINGAQVDSGRNPAALLTAICSAFNKAPAACSQKLATTNPDPGFGTTSSGSATDATCG